jgi:2-polyprenyl-3-methyl-5-hydroxy-6-metoxy-1,4-benzoquinol methylase
LRTIACTAGFFDRSRLVELKFRPQAADLSFGMLDQLTKLTIRLDAERDLAADSPDYQMPWGTRRNDSLNPRFNQKLWRLYEPTRIVRVLDLGCSGGGFVKSCIEDGHFAVGLEGSNFSKLLQRSAWATIPRFLFTCDITKPWNLLIDTGRGEEPLTFDVITAWDVIEHIREEDLGALARNVHRHLAPGGLFILSVANHEDVVGGVRLHQTVRPKDWWGEKFGQLHFTLMDRLAHYFSTQFVRGDRHESPISFHFVLSNAPRLAPSVPGAPWTHRANDRWQGSVPQRLLKTLVGV